MILTVTLNAAIDKTHIIPGFGVGAVNRPTAVLALAGGKGINVARVLRALDEPVLATGFVAGHAGAHVLSLMAGEGIPHNFQRLAAGESRTCLAVVHPEGPPHTEINEPGPRVDEAAFEAFVASYEAMLPQASWVALSGSLPPGLDAEAYLRLIASAKLAGKRVSLDTSGPELPGAIAGAPDVIKPNQKEAELVLGEPLSPANVPAAVERLLALGPRIVALTLGAAGAAIATQGEAWWVAAPDVQVVNPIGSGDSFLAALLAMTDRGASLAEAARWAVAAGSANAALAGAAACSRDEIAALVPLTRAVPLAEAIAPVGR